MACPNQLQSVGVRPGRFMLGALQEMFTEFMNAELNKMGIPAEFAVAEPGDVNRVQSELDAQLFEAFLGVKR